MNEFEVHRSLEKIKMTTTKLPELPEAVIRTGDVSDDALYASNDYYTADQLRAYGDEREAYGRATAHAEVAGDENWHDLFDAWWDSEETQHKFHVCHFGEKDIAGAGANWYRTNIATRPADGRDGFVMVPVEPTEAMLRAGERAYVCKANDMASVTPTEFPDGGPAEACYRAMLAAAPAPRPADPDFVRRIEP